MFLTWVDACTRARVRPPRRRGCRPVVHGDAARPWRVRRGRHRRGRAAAGLRRFRASLLGLACRAGLGGNHGTVDSATAAIRVCLINHDPRADLRLRRGDRIAQLVVQRVERVRFVEVPALPGSARGAGGYGSTGGHARLSGGNP